MQKYDFTAPVSGAPQVVNVPGRYLKYVTGTAGGNDAGLIITPGGKPGSKILLYPGQAVTLPDDGTPGPNAWTLANAVGAGQISGTVVVGDGRIDDNTTQGVVTVVDGGKSRTLANAAFAGFSAASAVAAAYGRTQLWNPAASGKRAVVEAVWLWAGSAATILLQDSTAALANTYEAASPKLLGGAAGAAACMYDTTAVMPATPAIIAVQVIAAQLQIVKLAEPIVIPPGHGLLAACQGVNMTTTANFEWYEEPNV